MYINWNENKQTNKQTYKQNNWDNGYGSRAGSNKNVSSQKMMTTKKTKHTKRQNEL